MKICIISDYCYPLRNDPTGKIAYLMAKSFSGKGHDVVVYTHSFSFRQKFSRKIDNLSFIINKSHQEKNYSFSELRFIYKNPFLFLFAIVKLFLIKVFAKFHILNKNKKDVFFEGLSEKETRNQFDIAIYVCGNFQICQLLINNKIKSKKNVLYAIDYWPNDYDYFVHSSFDCVYGQQSYEEKEENFHKKYKICTPLIDYNRFTDFAKSKSDAIKKIRYFGTLYGPRDYNSFLNFLDSINDNKLLIEIYSNLYKKKSEYKNIVFKKQKYDKEYSRLFNDSNILLVLDNNAEYKKWIPSKIYECMASNKPIVVFVSNKNSFIKKEIETYENKKVIQLNEINTEAINDFKKFVKQKTSNSVFDFKKVFPLSIPDTFVDDIVALF